MGRMEENTAELERLAEEARKAREAATAAQKIADKKTEEFFTFARWCLGMTEEQAKH